MAFHEKKGVQWELARLFRRWAEDEGFKREHRPRFVASDSYVLPTRAGDLHVTILHESVRWPCITARFVDGKLAAALCETTRVNPHTGGWRFIFEGPCTAADCLAIFVREFSAFRLLK